MHGLQNKPEGEVDTSALRLCTLWHRMNPVPLRVSPHHQQRSMLQCETMLILLSAAAFLQPLLRWSTLSSFLTGRVLKFLFLEHKVTFASKREGSNFRSRAVKLFIISMPTNVVVGAFVPIQKQAVESASRKRFANLTRDNKRRVSSNKSKKKKGFLGILQHQGCPWEVESHSKNRHQVGIHCTRAESIRYLQRNMYLLAKRRKMCKKMIRGITRTTRTHS